MNSVSEKIDERILRLLGLEDVFDLDYDTYLTLIREAMVSGANRFPPEELALLANERKRVRGKKGRFKPKKEEVKVGKDKAIKFLKGSAKVSTLISAISKRDAATEPQDSLVVIQKPLQSISKTLVEFLKFRKKTGEDQRREKETERRTKKEESLEGLKKGISAVSGAAKKMLAPFQSIIDRIWKFIFFTLLGRAFTQLMGWLGDPTNKKKIEVLGRFLKDWWPTLLGAAVLFFTPFGAFVRKTLGLVGFFTGRLVKLIPGIARAVKGLALNPWFAVPAAAVGLSVAANEVTGQRKAAPVQAANKARAQTGKGLGVQGIGGVGDMGPTTPYGLLQGAARGGQILKFAGGGISPGTGYDGIDGGTGQKVSGFGADTQMIVAQPGEIVMNKKTVDAVGANHFLGLNRMYGGPGANKPKMGRLYNTGGMVGEKPPRISASDYNSLLAISALEADESQGRADVAQSLYNRLYAANKYKVNFNQSGNSLKNLITAENQYEPTFSNRNDWLNINDRNSAAIAIMNSAKGKRYNWDLKEAMRQLDATEKSLKNPSLQGQSQKHVGGRAFFLGSSQQENMKPGDVLRGAKSNFFSPWHLEGTQYDKERRNTAASVPQMLLPKKSPPTTAKKSSGGTNIFGTMMQFLPTSLPFMGGGLIKENTGMDISGATADRQLAALQPGEYVLPVDTVNRLGTSLIDKLVAMTDSNSTPFMKSVNKPQITPLSRGNMQGMITLPPITQSASGGMGAGAAGSKVPSFSASSPSGGAERSMNASIYGIVG
jgi:hypothetical protein